MKEEGAGWRELMEGTFMASRDQEGSPWCGVSGGAPLSDCKSVAQGQQADKE